MVGEVDEGHILGLREMVGDEGLSKIVCAFLKDLPRLQEAAIAAVTSRDLVALRRVLHAFDGASSAIGLNTKVLFAEDLLQRCSLGYWPNPESVAAMLASALSGPVRRIKGLVSSNEQLLEAR